MSIAKRLVLILVMLFLSGGTAFATTFTHAHTYFVTLNFSGEAYGKSVRSVFAHVGVRTLSSGANSDAQANAARSQPVESAQTDRNYFWQEVQHVRMDVVDHHFFAKLKMHAGSSSDDRAAGEGPIVQYWVTFADGSSMVTAALMIPVEKTIGPPYGSSRTYDQALREQDEYFWNLNDANSTSCVDVAMTFVD